MEEEQTKYEVRFELETSIWFSIYGKDNDDAEEKSREFIGGILDVLANSSEINSMRVEIKEQEYYLHDELIPEKKWPPVVWLWDRNGEPDEE